MTITLVPDSTLNQVRLNIGDPDGALIADAVLSYLLATYDDDVNKVSIKAAEAILRDLAKLRDESVDEVYVKWSQTYEHYKQLYKDLLKSLGLSTDAGAFWFGGTSKQENCEFYDDVDSTGSPIKSGFITDTNDYVFDRNRPYSFRS
jgi:hypothetical protein